MTICRTLMIRLDRDSLTLQFGVFTWRVPVANIRECRVDLPPWLARYGGAGIHFLFVGGRYRASFNFLEHRRLVAAFKRKLGPVLDLSFSTARPESRCDPPARSCILIR